jgi:hypothetical protein
VGQYSLKTKDSLMEIIILDVSIDAMGFDGGGALTREEGKAEDAAQGKRLVK